MANEMQSTFLQQCLLCKNSSHTNQLESGLSDGVRFLKKNLLKSIKDPSILELVQTFPLCETCWLAVAHLQNMYKQLVAIRKEFKKLRAQFAKEFLEASQNQEKDQQVGATNVYPVFDLSTALEHGLSDIFNKVNNNSNCDIAPKPDQHLVQTTNEQINSSSGSQQQKEISRNHKCPSCDQAFRTRKNLRRHAFIHDKDKRFHCEICGKGFSLPDKFRRHKAQVHKIVEQPILCELCPKDKKRNFYSAAELEKHKARVHDPNFPNNNARRLKAARERARERARKELSNPKPGPSRAAVKKSHCCPLCGKSFDEGRFLQNHYLKEHPEEGSQSQQPKKEAQCEICGQSFSSRSSLKVHVNAAHRGIYRYKCQQCTEQFGNKLSLDRHLATHTGGKKPLSCNYCEEAFNYKLGLRKHLVKTHPEEHLSENPYACSTCFEVFKLEANLKKHESEAHFTCQICGQVFRTVAILKYHEVVHTAQKPFDCHICGKSFSTKGNLTQHMKGHTGNKPFPCGQCSLKFMRRKAYEKHVQEKHSAQQKTETVPDSDKT